MPFTQVLTDSSFAVSTWVKGWSIGSFSATRPTSWRAEEAQIDYGHLGSWTDPATGRQRRVWAFAMVLACSRHMFVRPVLTMDQRAKELASYCTSCRLCGVFMSGVGAAADGGSDEVGSGFRVEAFAFVVERGAGE
jgi:hypothetical protein